MAQDPYRYFRPEAHNLLDQFAQGVLELEKNGGGAGAVQRLLRLAHTLKGAARVVRQSAIAEHAHAIEDALAPFRDGGEGVARESIDAILTHLDEIGSQIVTLAPGEDAQQTSRGGTRTEATAPPTGVEAPKNVPLGAVRELQRVIRADIVDLDAMLDGISETHAQLNELRRSAEAVEQIGELSDLLRAQIAASGPAERSQASSSTASQSARLLEDLHKKLRVLARDLDGSIVQMDRELRQLHDAAAGLKLVPLDNVLMALKRTARDAARTLSKEVAFEGTGGDVRLDGDVLGIIQGALIQLVRNAVAHGIEPKSERLAAGKPAAGRITVNVFRRGGTILLRCRDDGRGIDLAAVRRAAAERGLLTADAGKLSTEDLIDMLMRGGVSTSAAVTDVAGRGVGLDVVRDALERLGGAVAVHIDPGQGTTFDLSIPRSVTSIPALIVEADKVSGAIAIPLDAVRRIVRLAAGDIGDAANGASVLCEEGAIAFVPLATALEGKEWSAGRAWTAIVVTGTDGVAAIGVERLAGTARTVIRPLPEGVKASPIVAGAALDGDGNPQLVLNPDGLVAAAHGQRGADRDRGSARRPLLVIDDSLTTRMLEKSILESAGYEVEVASSGEQGLDLARGKPFALILCDVEMPGIDGFTFVERIRSDPALRDIPAILVTSRCAPQDRERGQQVGARGYIVKSQFNQAELLAMIEPLVG